MNLHTIISGGQTGADQGGLEAAVELGLQTGGWMPKGFRTEAGMRYDMAQTYGMQSHPSSKYPPRTEANVLWGDATLVFGAYSTGGSALTCKLCKKYQKPYYTQFWNSEYEFSVLDYATFLAWIRDFPAPNILNVAGTSESKLPGVRFACRDFLINCLRDEQ